MITPLSPSKPSISVSNWLRVCSRSSLPPPILFSRLFPIASISSMNTMHGALACAWLNRSRTFAAPIPTNIWTNSDPDIEKNGTPASPATALAINVLPVPGGPTRRTPLGKWAPTSLYLAGLCRKSTTSISPSLASSCPATSEKRVFMSFSAYTLAPLCPNCIKLPIPPPLAILLPTRLIAELRSQYISIPGSTHQRMKSRRGERSRLSFFTKRILPSWLGLWAVDRRLTKSGSVTAPVT